MKSFPKPLTPTSEKYYFQRYKDGDPQAKQILIEHNLRLVSHTLKKYSNLKDDLEDYISIGTIGLIKAIHTFEPDHGNRLAAYATRCIDNEILMYLRSTKKQDRECSLYESIGNDREGNDILLCDLLKSDEEEILTKVSQTENIRRLYQFIENELSHREQLVLTLHYGLYQGEQYTQREIAEHLGISRSYVSRIEKKAIQKLRPYFIC